MPRNTPRIVHTDTSYKYYVGTDKDGRTYYNIVPVTGKTPTGGYYDPAYISRIKKVPNIFK